MCVPNSVSFILEHVHAWGWAKGHRGIGFYASPYLFVVSTVLSLSLALGTLQDWMEIMTLARSHQWSALNTFLLDKPVLKKVVFTTLALVSPRLYRVYFQHDYTSGFPSSLWGLCQSQGTVYQWTSLADFWPRPMGWVSLDAGGSAGSTTRLGGHETLYWMDGANLFKGTYAIDCSISFSTLVSNTMGRKRCTVRRTRRKSQKGGARF